MRTNPRLQAASKPPHDNDSKNHPDLEDGSAQQVYVGQTGDLQSRLDSHNRSKDFWTRVLVLISRTNNLTQTHSLFLEWHSLQKIRSAQRYSDANGNSGSKPYTPAPL